LCVGLENELVSALLGLIEDSAEEPLEAEVKLSALIGSREECLHEVPDHELLHVDSDVLVAESLDALSVRYRQKVHLVASCIFHLISPLSSQDELVGETGRTVAAAVRTGAASG